MKATIVCAWDCEGVDLRAAGAAIVIMTGDHAPASARMVIPGALITSKFRRDLLEARRIA